MLLAFLAAVRILAAQTGFRGTSVKHDVGIPAFALIKSADISSALSGLPTGVLPDPTAVLGRISTAPACQGDGPHRIQGSGGSVSVVVADDSSRRARSPATGRKACGPRKSLLATQRSSQVPAAPVILER
jgi:hypothetical protein